MKRIPQASISRLRQLAQPALRVVLTSVGNPDYGQNPRCRVHGVPANVVRVADYAEASRVCTEYIATYELGGGNWGGDAGRILDAIGNTVARVTYNGKVWPPEEWTPEQVPLYSP